MNKIKLLTIGVIGLLLLNLVLMGMMYMHRPIGPRPGDRHMKDDGPKQLIIDRLHLSDDQVKQYDILIDQHQSSINELDSKIKPPNTTCMPPSLIPPTLVLIPYYRG